MLEALPLWPAYAFTVVLFLALAVGSLLLPRRQALSDAPDASTWRDIRYWSVALVSVQLLIYWVFS